MEWLAELAEQLTCNQHVINSKAAVGFEFFSYRISAHGGIGRRSGFKPRFLWSRGSSPLGRSLLLWRNGIRIWLRTRYAIGICGFESHQEHFFAGIAELIYADDSNSLLFVGSTPTSCILFG